MKPLLTITLLIAFTAASGAGPATRRDPLSRFLGHWEGSGKFAETKFAPAHALTSTTDCSWSPQGSYLVCEQLIHENDATHTQLTVFMPDSSGDTFTFYSFNTPGQKPFQGSLTIKDNVWTYGPLPDAANSYPVFRTTNIFQANSESFKTEFSEDGSHWTTMLEGVMHQAAK